MLKLSFSIFHRARPQATISATLSLETGRLVTQAMEYLILPLASTISKPIQLTNIASLTVAQRDRLDPAITERLFRIAAADFLLVAAELGPADEVVQRLVGSRLAGEDEIVAGIRDHLGDGVAGEQIVAEEHGAQRRQ